jgi:PST family polysaccharide transporter
MLGADALGFYQNARSLTDEIRSRIAVPLQRVLFPAFSMLQANKVRLQGGIVRSGQLLAMVTLPMGIGVAAVAEYLVPVLYGPKWVQMVVPLQLISVSASIRAACAIASPIFNSINRVGLSFRLGIAGTVFTMISVAIGGIWGLVGVAAGVMVSSAFGVVAYAMALRCAGFGAYTLLRILSGPLIAALLMWVQVDILKRVLGTTLSPTMLLAVLIGGGVVCYAMNVLLFARAHAAEARLVARTFLNRS